jgi:23S rRNA maturation-related 3'-5' exoribonuclease YhaM
MKKENTEHSLLTHQNIGDSFAGIYYVENVFVKKAKNQKDFSDFTLRDKSGNCNAKYWGVESSITKGDFILIEASVEDYMGNPSMIIRSVEKVSPPEDLSNYIAEYEGTEQHAEIFDSIREELRRLEGKVGDNIAGRVVDEVYNNGAFFDKFIISSASITSHYGRRGGLLANTIRVSQLCSKTAELYNLSEQERIVLIASSFLFRIGAIDAFEFVDCMSVETKRGILLGINNLTMTRVSSALKRVLAEYTKNSIQPNQEIIMRILHAISVYSNSSQAMTKEALILASVYRTDRDMVNAVEFIENDTNITEEFTAYDPILRRRYYTGCKTSA